MDESAKRAKSAGTRKVFERANKVGEKAAKKMGGRTETGFTA